MTCTGNVAAVLTRPAMHFCVGAAGHPAVTGNSQAD
jgi:hypothetical protein